MGDRRTQRVTFQGIAPTAARAHGPQRGGHCRSRHRALLRLHGRGVGRADLALARSSRSGEGTRPIVNYTGGTETGGGILVAYPFLPMHAGGFNGPLPGMDVAVLDQNGAVVLGEIGELAVLNTWPGMTHAFWQDRERYLETYWNRWDSVWVHGDLASVGPGRRAGSSTADQTTPSRSPAAGSARPRSRPRC